MIAQYLTKLKLFWKIILSYFLTDQAFIVSQKYFKQQPKNNLRHYHLLGSGFTLWFIWQLSTITGIVVGEVIPKELNLAFAVPLTFISLIIVDMKKVDHLIVAITSGIFAVIFFNLPLRTYIIVAAAAGILVAYGLTHQMRQGSPLLEYLDHLGGRNKGRCNHFLISLEIHRRLL